MRVKVTKHFYSRRLKKVIRRGQNYEAAPKECIDLIKRGLVYDIDHRLDFHEGSGNNHGLAQTYAPSVEYRSLSDLNEDVKKLISLLPTDIDLVVGMPRCGMLPATLISMYWNLPLTDIFSFCEGKIYPHLRNNSRWNYSKIKKALIVDDSIASGRNMEKAKQMAENSILDHIEKVYAAVYATDPTKNKVDYYVEVVPHPRVWEWDITQNLYVQQGCSDIDGILCRDPLKEDKVSEEALSSFYSTVNPLIRPSFVDTLVTGRLEKFREETENWLKKNHIKYNRLFMNQVRGRNGEFKARVYENLNNTLFIESSPREAKIISKTGKQVIVPSLSSHREPVLSDIKENSLNILFHVMGMRLPGGASISCCEIMAALSRRGYNCKITAGKQVSSLWTPSKISHMLSSEPIESLYSWADAALIHWFVISDSEALRSRFPIPRMYYICDVDSPKRLKLPSNAELLIFNSNWLVKDTNWKGNQMVIHPPIYPELFRTVPGDKILMVTPDKSKGIDMFLKIAASMPDYDFVIAKGRTRTNLSNVMKLSPNVSYLQHLPDVREVYSNARLVLMPSREESYHSAKYGNGRWVEGYGRVAMEAACSGIPTIGSRESQGLQECLGEGGLFAGQNNVGEWIEAIKRLDDPAFYEEKSRYYLELVESRHPDKYIDELEKKIMEIVRSKK